MKKLRVVVVERAGVDAGVGGRERVAVIGKAGARPQALLAIGEGVGPDGVDVALVLNVVEHLVDALVDPGEAADLDADEVLAAAGGGARPAWSEREPAARRAAVCGLAFCAKSAAVAEARRRKVRRSSGEFMVRAPFGGRRGDVGGAARVSRANLCSRV